MYIQLQIFIREERGPAFTSRVLHACTYPSTPVCHSSKQTMTVTQAQQYWYEDAFVSTALFTHGDKAGGSPKPQNPVHGAGLDWTNATYKFSLKHQRNSMVAFSRTRLQKSFHSWSCRELGH